MNRYSDAAAVLADEQRQAVRSNVYTLSASSPDTAASAARLGRQTGLPPDLVQRNLPAVQQRVAVERVEADTAAAPVLRNRYMDPAFAAMAHDDSAALARFEQQSYTYGNALKKGVAGAKLTLDFAADQLARLFGADRTETRRILGETGDYYRAQGTDPQLQAAGERAKAAGGGTWYGTLAHLPVEIARADDPLDILGKFMTEQLPTSIAGFGLGAAASAPVRSAVAARVQSELVARGVQAGIAGAAGNSTAVVVQSLGVNYQEGLQQGLDERAAAQRAWKKTLGEVPANAIAGAAMGLRIGPNQLTNVLGQTAVQGAGGGTGAAMAASAVGEQADPVEIALEILGEGISAGPELAGLTFTRISESRTASRAEAAGVAIENAEGLAGIIKAADSTALKARDPETFADLVEHIHPEQALYIAPQHLEGVDLANVPGLAQRAAEAAATGGEVQLRLAELLAHLPGEQLLPHLRLAPDAMTAAEAQRFDGASELRDEFMAPPAESPLIERQAMTDADWQAYMQAADDSARQAAEVRDARTMRDMQWLRHRKAATLRKLAQDATIAREAIEPQARAEIEAQPVYAAQRFLASDEGKTLPADYVAEMHGFDSADAMQRAIEAAGPIEAAIENRVDERMREDHPDLVDKVARERAAEALLADRARTRFLATEAAALRNALGSRQMLERDARAYAQESIARREVREVRPAAFRMAAERAGREAAAAFRKGDTADAARAKRNQVLQQALEAEAQHTTAEIAADLERFRRILKPNDGTRDGNLADTARAILAQYGLASAEKTPTDYLAQVANYDPELHADLVMLMEGLPAPTHHRRLTVADFRLMRERVEAIWSLARSTRQIEIDGQMVEMAEAAGALKDSLAKETPAKRENQVGTNEGLDLRMRLAGMRAALRRVEAWADARDRGDPQGAFRRYVWQPVSEAVTRYRAERNAVVNRFLQLLKTVEPTLKPGKIAAPELGDGMVFADRSALLHALLHTGNESNKRKLLVGYGWGEIREDGSLDSSRWDRFVERMHTEGRITKADWDFAQATWDLLEEMKPKAQAAHRRMFGHYFAEVTADPVSTPFGELRGGYVPAITDSLLVPEARSYGTMDDMLASQNSPMFPAVARGFTKSRIEAYTKPLALDLRLLPAHLDKVARFAVMGPVLRDAARLVTRNRTFREAMNHVDPTAIESMLVPWLKRTAAQSLTRPPESQADRAVARIANTVRNRTGLLLMAGNVVNTLQQVTGLSVAALRVKPRHLGAGLVEMLRSPRQAAAAIHTLSPWMQERSSHSARDVDLAIDRMLTNPNWRQQAEQAANRFGYALQQTAQNFLDRIVWIGAFRQAEAAGATDADAVRQADAAVRMTQGSFAPEDAAKVEHAGAFTRLFLQFASYFNAQGNLLATEAQNAQGNAARLALVYLLGFAVPAFTADVIAKGMRGELGEDDEDGDELAQQLLESFALSQARYALAMVPVAGQVGNAAIGQWTPERFDDRIGASPAYSAIEATVRAPRSIVRAIEGDGNPRAAVRDGLTAVGLLTGLPTGPLVRPLGHLADDEAEDVTLQGLVTGR